MSLGFWSKIKKIDHTGYGQNFQIWGQKNSDDFMVPNDTGRTTEDILSVETG